MRLPELHILSVDLLGAFKEKTGEERLYESFQRLTDADISTETFSFYTSVSSVFSSKIEGEAIELDSYIKHKRFGVEFLPDYTKKIDDLYTAYTFAKEHPLTKDHLLEAHGLLSRHLVGVSQQGRVRSQNMFVVTPDGKIGYVAASPLEVIGEMEKLYGDIERLLAADLSVQEVFFFAAMVHLVFVKVHPFSDGNGRTGRLLEKWFLAQKLGEKAWFLQSEKYYYDHHQAYYHNLRALGLEYPELDYAQALSFLLMLPGSLELS